MKVVIAGGGTGGHLFPGIAVAEELAARGHEVRFVGTARGIEARVCPKEGWPLDLIDVAGLKGSGPLGLVKGLLRVPRALWQSWRLLSKHRPDLVIGVGGYASGPMVLAAALTGRPTAILEQNSVPGITNRILGKLVRVVFGAFEAARRSFPSRKYRLVGNPVRRGIREKLQASGDGAGKKALLVVGGSQGAKAVNELVSAAMQLLANDGHAPALRHQTGAADFAAMQQKYAALQNNGAAIEVSPFIEDMAAAYRAAALVVARAGASTLAELTALGLPSLLIPFPHAADDHQTVNARELEAAGAARLMPQASTTPAELARAIDSLLADDVERARMAQAARALARPNAHAEIADALESLVTARARKTG
jgi:UDP-N-acetylglucosamine--N-acetylmuramyl-(pentapeptide) pyrophosphoryl-undecaprenol N-acetylglucosamine transferase